MHNCEEFRERITGHIIDREDLSANAEFQNELLICSRCSEFYAESREMMDALSSVEPGISESQWSGIEHRLRSRIHAVGAGFSRPRAPKVPLRGMRPAKAGAYVGIPFLLAAAALLLITIGLSRPTPVAPAEQATYIEQSVPLDPVTLDFLEDSELLLRNVMKISSSDIEDLTDAKRLASRQLAGIEQRKEAAADVPPVVDVISTYETVLRDLRNIDEKNAAEDIPDIQKRIQQNALIANMKAFQPTVTQISFGLR